MPPKLERATRRNKVAYEIRTRKMTTDEGSGWLAEVPKLPGCMGDGESKAAAIANVKLAIVGWLKTAKELGRDIPPE